MQYAVHRKAKKEVQEQAEAGNCVIKIRKEQQGTIIMLFLLQRRYLRLSLCVCVHLGVCSMHCKVSIYCVYMGLCTCLVCICTYISIYLYIQLHTSGYMYTYIQIWFRGAFTRRDKSRSRKVLVGGGSRHRATASCSVACGTEGQKGFVSFRVKGVRG